MYFTKQERKFSNFYAPEMRYSFFTECSKGIITLTPGCKVSPTGYGYRRNIYVQHQGCKPPDITYWRWEVKRWLKSPKTPQGQSSGALSFGHVTPTQRPCEHSFGQEPTLYRAAKAALQRLFTYRRCTLSELMKMLVNDQVVYELSKIGGPS
jgi:hypothetical protein